MKLFVVLVLVMCPLDTLCYFNMTAYRQMPPLHTFDDYDACLDEPKPSSYCLVIAEIVPNDTSALWNQIAEFSSDSKRHFRHDSLFFGVCLNRCKNLVSSLSTSQKDQLYAGNIQNTEVSEYLTDVFTEDSDNRILYDKVINICLNYNFKKQYNLQLRSFIEYCVANESPKSLDYLEIILFVLIGIVLFLVILSSHYDRLLKSKQPTAIAGHEFYKQRLHTKKDTILTSYSLCRIYFRLTMPSTGELARDLRFFEAFRFCATTLVISGHVLLIYMSLPIQNTERPEQFFHKYRANLLINGPVIIQMFLVMSSFLLTIGFQRELALKKPGILEWGILILYRYIRLAPSLAFTILLNASILPRLQDGPIWRHISGPENVLCRATWWKNLLFINNLTMMKSCLHQTWYIAADFQLYIILAALLIIIARFPRTKLYILVGGIAASILTTGLVTYILELDHIYQETPEAYRYLFWTNGDNMYRSYTPFYMNFGGPVFGSLAAFIYLKYKDQNLNLKGKKLKLNILSISLFPLLFLLLLSAGILHRFGLTKPSIWIAIYAGLFRNLWALICAIFLPMMCFKVGLIFYKFSSLKIFAPLGRLSFQAYLIHTLVIRCLIGCFRQPLHINLLILTMLALTTIVLSFAAAFFLYMFIELPLTTLVNAAFKPSGNKLEKVPSSSLPSNGVKKEMTATNVTPATTTTA